MSNYQKPLPVIQPHSAAFWEGTRQHKLMIQHCRDCDSNIFYPRKHCPECWSENLDWIESSGKAKVFSFSVTYEGLEPMFQQDLPIILAWVDLPEGVRMCTNLLNCDPDEIEIGMEVDVVFQQATEDITIPYFTPSSPVV
ncbi:Zn-ribbon domain-containing OB-fold protein [Pseudomaricurvus alkylphenolicus]|uniref:Zn-ribbon domain-containing OB-fold protein n=1 Tax=Pseudomaricurvus alkylphenolicus TaxID=1306991 RepID=UPI00141EB369|nr:Zn-ribbon domain-containing OB-fold protein [Pseudomaricurvus alkylphenolicus]NIB38056.1 Zn-ribbon domain-containing OB-fold protein [Pseudomaricurvus alkylphenolicus]